MLIIDVATYLFIILLYSAVIIGYGAKFKNLFFKADKNSIGEFGIYGFIVLYFLSTLIHFFIAINLAINLFIFAIGIYLFAKEIKLNQINFLINKKFVIVFLLFFLLSFTNQFHDDAYLYQLPYINYVQKFKIIFGIVTINDYMAYGHGFYDILALFKLPKISNSLIFTLPVIFLAFFILYLYEQRKNYNYYIKFFLVIIIITLLFRYYQSKDYGTDLPVLVLIFLVQINLINYFFNKNINFFYKSILYLVTGILFKIYMIFSIFYLIPFIFLTKIKKIKFEKHKNIIFFIFLLIFLSIGKNVIHSGCLIYPIHQTCFESEKLSWSYGKDLSKKRMTFLSANNKGWLSYYRFMPKSKFFEPDVYIKKYKYNYHKNLIKDQDFSSFILIIAIFLILLNLNKNIQITNKIQINNKYTRLSSNQKKYLFLSSLFAFLSWFILTPHLRYGGYGFLIFLLFSTSIILNLNINLDFKKTKIFICIALSFLIIKNFSRIYKEISYEQFSVIPQFENISFSTKKISSFNINISEDNNFCGNIEMLCIIKSNLLSIKNIRTLNSFLLITNNKNQALNNMKLEVERARKKINKDRLKNN